MIETKALAVLMVTHSRLGAKSILPNDIIVVIATLFQGEVNEFRNEESF